MGRVEQRLRVRNERERIADLRRCQRNLFYLSTEKLDYGWNRDDCQDRSCPIHDSDHEKGLTVELHKPVCDWLDENRTHLKVACFFPRFHHKSTMVVAQIIQDLLINPEMSIFYVHAVEEEAENILAEVAWHLQHNPKIRALDPIGFDPGKNEWYRALPGELQKKWAKTDHFTLRRRTIQSGKAKFRRQPSLRAVGVNTEITGAHADKGYIDDVVGLRTVRNNQLGYVRDWYENTFLPVIGAGNPIRCTGTRWHEEAIYEDFIESDRWLWWVRACSELAPNPPGVKLELENIDPKCENAIHFGPPGGRKAAKRRLLELVSEMKSNAYPQMFNFPMKPADRPWVKGDCEHYVKYHELTRIQSSKNFTVVIQDPAPKGVGGEPNPQIKNRSDMGSDYWAIAVVRYVVNGMRLEKYLLDGRFSRQWSLREGMQQACQLHKRWNTPWSAIEEIGSQRGIYKREMQEAASDIGVQIDTSIELKTSGQGKNVRFADLASTAARNLFFITDKVDEEFLDMFLIQARRWPQTTYDDCADAVAYCEDPGIDLYLPMAESFQDVDDEADDMLENDRFRSRARHILL